MFRQIAAFFLLTTLASCASQDLGNFVPVTPDRIEYLGVSLLPPPGNNWYVDDQRDLNEWRILFNHKLPDTKTDSGLYLMVVVDALPVQFHPQYATRQTVLDEFRKRLEAPEPGHVKILADKSTFITVDGSDAVRHTRTTEDDSNPAAPALIVETESIALAHPKDPTLGVMVTLTSRHLSDAPHLPPLTDAFLQHLHFTPPVRDAMQ